jgi:DNA-3-methyladenine glycosylase II
LASFELAKPAEFDLAECAAFLTGFRAVSAAGSETGLDLAFALDGDWEPVGVHISDRNNVLAIDVRSNPDGASNEAVQQNLDRVLGLSLDIGQYRDIGERDPVIGQLQRDNPGVRPVLFPTAWEAGVWSVITQRTRRVQAVAIKQRLAETHGNRVVCPDGSVIHGFPGPATLRGISEIKGLPLQKIEWLHGLADAALMGVLDCDVLAGVPQADGMAALRAIPGIGPFSSELILARGAGNPDIFPMHEPMLHETMTRLYGIADKNRHRELAEAWRPYRSWVSFLIRVGG